jgi:hypothetical protein
MLSADEVGRALSGSLKLLNRDAEGYEGFEVSIAAFWRSFLAVVLTAPAFVTTLAFDRKQLGLPMEDGLFAETWLVARELAVAGLAWIAFPLAMVWVVRRLGLGNRYVGYIIAYNWSAVITTAIFALPTALYVLGLATHGLSLLYAFAFGIIVAQYRWFLARTSLGVSGSLAALLVGVDFGLNGLIGVAVGLA